MTLKLPVRSSTELCSYQRQKIPFQLSSSIYFYSAKRGCLQLKRALIWLQVAPPLRHVNRIVNLHKLLRDEENEILSEKSSQHASESEKGFFSVRKKQKSAIGPGFRRKETFITRVSGAQEVITKSTCNFLILIFEVEKDATLLCWEQKKFLRSR
jgi:hypothetical protein